MRTKEISEFLQAHSSDGLNPMVQHIIQTTKCAANCQTLISNPKYQDTLKSAEERGTLTPTHQIILKQLKELSELKCHTSSLRRRKNTQ